MHTCRMESGKLIATDAAPTVPQKKLFKHTISILSTIPVVVRVSTTKTGFISAQCGINS